MKEQIKESREQTGSPKIDPQTNGQFLTKMPRQFSKRTESFQSIILRQINSHIGGWGINTDANFISYTNIILKYTRDKTSRKKITRKKSSQY